VLPGADEQDRYPARPGRRFGNVAELGVQDAAVAMAAEDHRNQPGAYPPGEGELDPPLRSVIAG
jgi:hypothetical protein